MVIHLIQDAAPWLADVNHWADLSQLFHWHLPPDLMILDKPIKQTDLGGDFQRAFDNFIKSGQAWAFLIGLVFGYLVKTFTSFG
jgi:hypothetical protein